MSRVLSSQLHHFIGQKVSISGWLHKKRELGQLIFLMVRDRGGLVQVVVEDGDERAKIKTCSRGVCSPFLV